MSEKRFWRDLFNNNSYWSSKFLNVDESDLTMKMFGNNEFEKSETTTISVDFDSKKKTRLEYGLIVQFALYQS